MARAIGIDISTTHIRAVTVVSSYRNNVVERTSEIDLSQFPDLRQALTTSVAPMIGHGESVAIGLSGIGAYLLRVELPGTALRQIEQIIPFELEARVPVDVDELVHDFVINRDKGESDTISALIVAAPTAKVRSIIDDCRAAVGKEAERIGAGPLPISNLIPFLPRSFSEDNAVVILDLGERSSDILVVQFGRPVFARTISRGVDELPASAAALAASVRQTIFSWVSQTDRSLPILYLTGVGANVEGAEAYLSQHLEMSVLPLPKPTLNLAGDMTWESTMRYSKAIGIALGLGNSTV